MALFFQRKRAGLGMRKRTSSLSDFMGWTTPWYSTADCGDLLATRTGGDLRCYLWPATRCFKRMKQSGEELRQCCPHCNCSTSLPTAGRKRGRTRPPAGHKTRLARGGGVTGDRLRSGRGRMKQSNRPVAALKGLQRRI
jgi:hypothetical protein